MRTMQTGHPYLTQQLDDLRSAQRKLLSRIPDHWLSDAYPSFRKDYDHQAVIGNLIDRHRLESDLRALVVTRFGRVDDWVTELGTPFRSDDILEFLDKRLNASSAIAEELYNTAYDARQSGEADVSPELKRDIRAVVALLIWADELADDGYCDPRVADRQPGRDLVALQA
jgi:hypothetical protein